MGRMLWLPSVLKAAGLEVREVDGWRTRGRDTMAPEGVVAHHTGSDNGKPDDMGYAEWLAKVGRPDVGVPAPLGNLYLDRDNVWYVLAAGKANHAGRGSWRGIAGNSRFIGIEAENTGRQTWTNYESYTTGCAALLRHIGKPADMLCGHKEYAEPAGRKWDPGGIDMDAMRHDVGVKMVPDGKPDQLTTDEVEKLRGLIFAWESVGSNPSFPKYTIQHVRNAR